MRVALFARVSSDEQAEADRVSLPAQLRVMRERCAREKWDVVRTFEAAGESAFTDDLAKRPTLLSAVAAAEQGEFDLLMVHESSRFARSALLALQVKSRLEKAGVVLLDAAGAMGSRTAESSLMFTVTAGMNEWYSAKLSEHLRKAKEQQFEEGLHLGHPPFGYLRAGRRRPFAIVPEEAEAVREAFRDYAAGATYTAIARQWTARGLVPRSNDGHTQFTVPAMQSILENRFYAGWVSHKEQWRRGAHEALISDELWQRAQLRVRRRESHATRNRRLLSGVASCSRCKGPMWLTSRKGGAYWYYREASALRGESCEGAGKMVSASSVEAEFETALLSMTLNRDWLRGVAREAHRAPRRPKADIGKLLETKRRLSVAFVEGGLDDAVYRRMMRETERELSEAREPVRLGAVKTAGERMWDIGCLWRAASEERKRELPRLLFEEVLVDVFAPKGSAVWLRPWPDFAPYFAARVGCLVGPPGFEPAKQPTGLYLASALAHAS